MSRPGHRSIALVAGIGALVALVLAAWFGFLRPEFRVGKVYTDVTAEWARETGPISGSTCWVRRIIVADRYWTESQIRSSANGMPALEAELPRGESVTNGTFTIVETRHDGRGASGTFEAGPYRRTFAEGASSCE